MIDTWAEAHDTSGRGNKLSGDEKDEIWEWMQSKKIPLTLKEAGERANGRGTG
jgi:transposase